MGKMNEAIDLFFSKLREYCQIEFNSYPKVSFDDDINKELVIGKPDNEGYIAWLPKKIDKPFDFIPIEREYNFFLNEEIREYYTSYLFLSMSGFFEDLQLDFEPVSEYSEIEVTIRRHINNGRYYFPDKDYLLIGSGGDGDDDSYNVFYDNWDSKLVCVSTESEHSRTINQPLSSVIRMMEAIE